MPEARSISCAAWAPVSPRKVRTVEYFLKADFVRQLAHNDRASAGRMKRKYVGSICMNMVFVPFRERITGRAHVVFLPLLPNGVDTVAPKKEGPQWPHPRISRSSPEAAAESDAAS